MATPQEALAEILNKVDEADPVFEDLEPHVEFADAVPILFCPVCCSQVDPDNWGLNTLECHVCESAFIVNLTERAVREHSIG